MLNPISTNVKTNMTGSLTEPVDKTEGAALKDFSKDFEELVLKSLFDVVEKSMSRTSLSEDSASGQVYGMYWMFLSKQVAQQGGIGLADNIYSSLKQDAPQQSQLLDQKV